jgi:hypothetical protein
MIENPSSPLLLELERANFKREGNIVRNSLEVKKLRHSILRSPTPREFKLAFIRK